MFSLRHTTELDKAILGGGLDILAKQEKMPQILIPIAIVCKFHHLC